ncbi:MAG: hypothetical protein ABIS30_06440 [Gallionella sp.]|jgi:hypothetical protein
MEKQVRHWYVYHSQKTMGHTYASLGKSGVYSTPPQPKLCINDKIWVIEGDVCTPTNFRIADCFHYLKTSHPPFAQQYADFKFFISGDSLLPKQSEVLSKESSWFAELHKKFITKQRFFASITDNAAIIDGLIAATHTGATEKCSA